MPKYKICLAYDGTSFCGWQIQPNRTSIQGLIEETLTTLLKTKVRVVGAGRTDAGVHALEQVAHFSSETPLECGEVKNALNGMLPYTIRIKDLSLTLDHFHAQYTAIGKEYHYHLWLEKIIDPFFRLYRHHFHDTRFSLPLLKEAATYFRGTHDFTSFANVGGKVKTSIRTLKRLDVIEQEGGVRLEFEGDGFLYKMVRNIVGTLLEISTKKRFISDIDALFAAKDRKRAGAAAPPRGLFLVKVTYPSLFLKSSEKEGKEENSRFKSKESCLISEGSK